MIVSEELERAIRRQLPVHWAETLSPNIIALMAVELRYIKLNTKSGKAEKCYIIINHKPIYRNNK